MAALHYRSQRQLLDADLSTSSPGNVNGTKGSYSADTNFDTNMVIILAALLCALICALGLNSIVRCALRCSRSFSFNRGDDAASRLATKGLKKSALRQIPITVYGSSGSDFSATECPICLGEFVDGEKVRILPKCNHGFHVRCIDTWLLSQSSCPTCRQSLLEQPRSSGVAAAGVAAVANEAGIRHHTAESASGGHEQVVVSVAVE